MRCKSLQLRWQKLFAQSFSTLPGRWGLCGWPKSLLGRIVQVSWCVNTDETVTNWTQWAHYLKSRLFKCLQCQNMFGVKASLKILLRFPENMSGQVYGLAISNTSAHVCTLGHLPNFNSRFPVAQLLFSFPGATKHKQLYLLIFVAHIRKIRGKHANSFCGIDFYFLSIKK